MPKVKYLQRLNPYKKLAALFYGAIELQGLTRKGLPKVLGQNYGTTLHKLKNPQELSVGQLVNLSQHLGITADEILDCLRW